MSITNRDRYPDGVFFSELDFVELGKTSGGAKIIQVGAEGDGPLVALVYTADPATEPLHAVELWSLMKFSQDPNEFQIHAQPKKLNQRTRTIRKFKIPSHGEFSLTLPSTAEILTIQSQEQTLCLWAMLEPKAAKRPRDFVWVRTGDEFDYPELAYITTMQFADGKQVAHLFELKGTYSRLERLLSRGEWQEADLETFMLLGELCGLNDGYDGTHIAQAGINQISGSALHTIDRLWLRYSQGRFGYTAQRSAWQEFLRTADSTQQNRNLWGDYCKAMGWNTGFSALNFSLNVDKGYLPAIVGKGMCWGPVMFEALYRGLWSRLQ